MSAVRTLVVWCPDWPVVAALREGLALMSEPVAVLRSNRVVAASTSARNAGVRRAMRRREAQSRCPELIVVDDDPGRDARLFEPVAAAIDAFTPRIEIVRPGLCQFPTRGPSRYFGGDAALADAIRLALAVLGVEARIGVADGAFAAALASRTADRVDMRAYESDPLSEHHLAQPIVQEGQSPAYLAPFPINALVSIEGGRAVTRAAATARRAASSRTTPGDALALIDLVDLLTRLGITTLGSFAALPSVDVGARFGPVGERAWRLANGFDARPPQTRVPPPDLVVQSEFDPPVDRVDTAAFVAKTLAEEFHERLTSLGMACTRVRIEAVTTDGVELVRLWRHERAGATGGLTAQNLADRVRWQIDGWLQQRSLADQRSYRAAQQTAARPQRLSKDGELLPEDYPERLTGGLTTLRLVPDEVVPDEGKQLRLWGGSSAADEQAARAFARVQGLLGPDAVCTPMLVGGRRPAELITLVPWGDERVAPATAGQPWPGQLPGPLPTVVHPLPLPAELLDASGELVRVSGRGELSDSPATLRLGRSTQAITNWAGPWPLEEKWWDLQSARRQARLQVIVDSKRAYLVVSEAGAWWVEGEYG